MNSQVPPRVLPILKWPGGKRWLSPFIAPVLARELTGTYCEPFLGGGATYLELKPPAALLSDSNAELIAFYRECIDTPEQVVAAVQRNSNEEDCYYRIRRSKPRTAVGKAAKFLFLNRTCWGGIYRLNQRGEFNVPFGDSGRQICCKSDVLAASSLFAAAELECCDFAKSIDRMQNGDVVFADPPYTSRGQFNGFVRYNERLFSWDDQQRLSDVSKSARKRGVFVAVCGSFHRDVLSLYENWWVLKTERHSNVARSTKSRKSVCECIVFSRKPVEPVAGLDRITGDFIASVPHHD
ncbi:DNA adenine methylase [Neorhodopirellula lusitana]|uniref:Site-specific DNA-methyltransferase (adenine-specific) n=1 Tax=Neorhodopirellula lusitana TaxID=445327 RepID=A0ABY1QSG1_9BACT|nr:DNA adenine methylase [Neorhodopirellula lusitana]